MTFCLWIIVVRNHLLLLNVILNSHDRTRVTQRHSGTAAKWVRMLHYSSNLSVQGCDFSSANISWHGFFRRDNSHVTAGQLQSLNSRLLPKYFILLSEMCDGGGSTETLLNTVTLSVLVWTYSHEMKTGDGNFKNAAILAW